VAKLGRCLDDLRFVVVSIERDAFASDASAEHVRAHQRAASLRYTTSRKRILFGYVCSLRRLPAPFGRRSSAAALLTPISHLHMPTPTPNITYAKVPADREPHTQQEHGSTTLARLAP
jgi:hypothetical protein